MPHFTLEYSANLDARVDMGTVVEVVRKTAVETGIFPLGGIRVRAVRCEHFAIADGSPELGFLAMVLRLGEGRDLATRKEEKAIPWAELEANVKQVLEAGGGAGAAAAAATGEGDAPLVATPLPPARTAVAAPASGQSLRHERSGNRYADAFARIRPEARICRSTRKPGGDPDP